MSKTKAVKLCNSTIKGPHSIPLAMKLVHVAKRLIRFNEVNT